MNINFILVATSHEKLYSCYRRKTSNIARSSYSMLYITSIMSENKDGDSHKKASQDKKVKLV